MPLVHLSHFERAHFIELTRNDFERQPEVGVLLGDRLAVGGLGDGPSTIGRTVYPAEPTQVVVDGALLSPQSCDGVRAAR
jgi:hypothetical protein